MLTFVSAASAYEMNHHSTSPAVVVQGPPEEAQFLAENESAMEKMMVDMASRPTGDVDRDFVEMMIPHHQGGIDMALAFLKYGHNERLQRLAQEIIITQQQEIAAMRLAIGDPLPATMAVPGQPPPRTEP
ncbi:DUF305 domain-containing protein [Pseudomonas sp. CCM 7891]|uniref:DUF305 domain-containing protein n=2 Tax=Pseudomonas karstica TaxID=1055468 RepID=A0A7X2RRN4_9PSED|nr:DUF305 domain-containing protein [Pseudomonas karstica]